MGVMTFGGGSSPWEFGWEALAAIGTLLAVLAALGIHIHQQRANRIVQTLQRSERTKAVAPQLAADAMLLHWQIASAMREVMYGCKLEVGRRTAAWKDAWTIPDGLRLTIQPGSEVYAGDIEWLTDPVRQKLAEVKAQVTVSNAMWHKLLIGPIAPFVTREDAINEMAKAAAHQLVDTGNSVIGLLQVLEPYLVAPLTELRPSIEQQNKQLALIYNNVPYAPRPKKQPAGHAG